MLKSRFFSRSKTIQPTRLLVVTIKVSKIDMCVTLIQVQESVAMILRLLHRKCMGKYLAAKIVLSI